MKIVKAEKADAPMIGEAVVTALGEELCRDFASPYPVSDLTTMFCNLAARDDSQYSYVNTLKALDDDGRPMGFVVGYDGAKLHQLRLAFFEGVRATLHRELEGTVADECDPDEFYLDSLAVYPEYRGKGVARALIAAMADRAAACGKPLGLLCDKTNARARRLYDSIGFIQVGENPFAGEIMDHMQIPVNV